MVELVDTQDLGSCAFGREGSSPFSGTSRAKAQAAERGQPWVSAVIGAKAVAAG